MTRLHPAEPSPVWKQQTILQRVLSCAAMLHVHQFLSDAERQSVQKRILKWLDSQPGEKLPPLCRHAKAGKPKPLRLRLVTPDEVPTLCGND